MLLRTSETVCEVYLICLVYIKQTPSGQMRTLPEEECLVSVATCCTDVRLCDRANETFFGRATKLPVS